MNVGTDETLSEVVGGEPVSGVADTSQAPTLDGVDAGGEPLQQDAGGWVPYDEQGRRM